jgi:uncharacterized protein YodC (DUF2158 family)
MRYKKWDIGDVVVLKSGGPKMTVTKLKCFGRVECSRFDLYEHGYDTTVMVFHRDAIKPA